jgi:hypothetical protein
MGILFYVRSTTICPGCCCEDVTIRLQSGDWRCSVRHVRVQVGEQRVHLLFCESAGEAGHLAFALEDQPPHLGICCQSAAGKMRFRHRSVNVWRRWLQGQIVIFVTMGASDRVQVLAFSLLRVEFGLIVAAGKEWGQSEWQQHCCRHRLAPSSSSLSLDGFR